MKYAIIGISVLVIGGAIWFFVAGKNVENPATLDSGPSSSEKTTEMDSKSVSDSGRPSEEDVSGQGSEPGTPGTSFVPPNEGEDVAFEEGEESDYSEPVDKEDFVDFVNAALEELESDEVMASAIVTEMSKILEAQPALEEEGIRFYRKCLEKSKVSESVKSRCQDELKKRGQ